MTAKKSTKKAAKKTTRKTTKKVTRHARQQAPKAAEQPVSTSRFDPDSSASFTHLLERLGACEPAREAFKGMSLRQVCFRLSPDHLEWAAWLLVRWCPGLQGQALGDVEEIRAKYTPEILAADIACEASGDRVSVGVLGTATAGYGGTATAGYGGTATAGYGGTATAGYGGTATAGDRGTLILQWYDSSTGHYRRALAEVGDGIEAGVAYRLDDAGRFVRVEKPAPPAAEATAP